MNNQPLIVRHRPANFDEVYGNTETIAALARRVKDPGRPHAYLFTGPSGIGKTTLSRIIGNVLDAAVDEVDAASFSGVDAMRLLVEQSHYMRPGSQCRMIIIDECHRLTQNAWDAALKMLEEPPDHLYLALCTTDLSKVPNTIITRCYHVTLNPLTEEEIGDYLIEILTKEKWMETTDGDVLELIIQESQGSPRMALNLLDVAREAPTRKEAQRIVALQGSANPMIQILKILISRQGGWDAIRPMLAQLSDNDFTEASLIHVSRYIIGAMNREENEKRATSLWELLAAMTYPARSHDPKSVFYAAIGRILWG